MLDRDHRGGSDAKTGDPRVANLASLPRRAVNKGGSLRRRAKAFHMRSAGFTGPAARRWVRTITRDRQLEQPYSAAERERAYRWGFTPSIVANFGVTEENRDQFISLREYLYAQPFNGKYNKWVRDRVSALLVFEPFASLFDTVHYQLIHHDGVVHISPISSLARSTGTSADDIVELVLENGNMIIAPNKWVDRDRVRVRHEGGAFFLDDLPCSRGEVVEHLLDLARDEPIVVLEAHPGARSDNRGIRVNVTMMNQHGDNPTVAAARVVWDEGEAESADDERPAHFVGEVDRVTGRYESARGWAGDELHTFENHPDTGEPFSGPVSDWADIVATLQRMCSFAPQLKFIEFSLAVGAHGFRIVRTSASPTFSREFPYDSDVVQFLREIVEERFEETKGLRVRTKRGLHNARLKLRREFARLCYPKGLVPYQSVRWIGDMRRDLLQRNGVSLTKKFWAYKHGFLSYRLAQYGITKANRQNFISDFEYRWLRHINHFYKFWLEDKVSIKYVAAEFNEFLPDYYFYTSRSAGRNHVVPMMDCPEGYGANYEDVLSLARDKGVLALKPDEGSHGEGFYRLTWDGSEYALNGSAASSNSIIELLSDPKNKYLVTEFIEMHPRLAEIYPNSVNTIRMIVFKRDGRTPELGNTYIRIGSLASGYVDNTAAGGMLAEIDAATGRFGNAKVLENGAVVDRPRHPDTGVLIEGVVPHWDFIKAKILEMAEHFTQLEYLGFDVAVTPTGFKLPEINRFPDYPRIDRFPPEIIDYLLRKLDQKKRRYGYDRRRPVRLITLPKRDPR